MRRNLVLVQVVAVDLARDAHLSGKLAADNDAALARWRTHVGSDSTLPSEATSEWHLSFGIV